MILTEEILSKGLSSNDSFSFKQIKVLGDSMTKKGWRKRLIGKEVSGFQINQFISLKDAHLKPKNNSFTKYICNYCGSEDIVTVLK